MRLPCRPRLTIRCALLAVLALWAGSAAARMYQWVDTQTGTVQLSGSPPSWYRGKQPGPRVFVFDNGQLVDDTARSLPSEEAALLRATAFGEPVPQAPLLRAPLFDPPTADAAPSAPDTATALPPEDSTSRQIAEFKALLEAYDRTQEQAAHDTLDAPLPIIPAKP